MASEVFNRTYRLALVVLVLGVAVLGWQAQQASAATSESFEPVRTTRHALYFKVSGLDPATVTGARAIVRVARRSSGAVRRLRLRIGAERIRRAIGDGRRLKVRVRGKLRSGRLVVRRGELVVARRKTLETTITSGPSGTIDSSSASFGFSATLSGSTFECRMDGSAWASCTNPKTYSSLAEGSHAFEVRARYRSQVDGSPATRSFSVAAASPSPAPPPPPPPSGCEVDAQSMTAAGCTLLKADNAGQADPISLWRGLDCVSPTRHLHVPLGGDPAPSATGQSQGNSAYRQLTVMDGDDFYGERCELGKNNIDDTFQTYREGQRRITFVSFRLPGDFPLSVDHWHQVVMQMKQTQPSNNGGGTPVLAMHALNGQWQLDHSDSAGPTSRASKIWSAPAQKATWTRAAFDVTYSQNSSIGRVKVYIDSNGDGDATDAGEQSPTFNTYTLKYETTGTRGTIAPGDSIPSHLRVGPYRNPDLPCPTTGCSVQVDNVQILRP